jgi:leader peptidase (prepilin peptidase)/N-methyltransferase
VYPALELLTGVLVSAVFFLYEDIWVGFLFAGLLALMPALSLIDIQHRIIPNRVIYPALIVAPLLIMAAWVADAPVDPVRAVIGFAAFGGGLFVIAAISRGMGMGDVKLAALEGIVFGSLGLRFVGVAAGAAIVLGGLGGIAALAAGRGRKSAIPFGPYLAGGAVIAALWGAELADWYLDTFL